MHVMFAKLRRQKASKVDEVAAWEVEGVQDDYAGRPVWRPGRVVRHLATWPLEAHVERGGVRWKVGPIHTVTNRMPGDHWFYSYRWAVPRGAVRDPEAVTRYVMPPNGYVVSPGAAAVSGGVVVAARAAVQHQDERYVPVIVCANPPCEACAAYVERVRALVAQGWAVL